MVYTRLQKKLDADKKAAAAMPAAAAATPAAAMPAAAPLSIAQIKTRSKSHAIERETIRHDTMLAAMGLLALHDIDDPPLIDVLGGIRGVEDSTIQYKFKSPQRNRLDCVIL